MYKDVLKFWFEELTPGDWFAGGDDLDRLIKQRFGPLLHQAVQGELYEWRETTQGRLAEIIVLDQFSRNIYRDSAKAFSADPLALVLAQEAIAQGVDQSLSAVQRSFLYMPFMHSESLKIHEKAVQLFKANGLEGNIDFENKHKVIIERFGRYPHRNDILNRASTAEEIEFLTQPGSRF